jgi:hypothetical protein
MMLELSVYNFGRLGKSDVGYQPRVANDCGAQFYSNEEQFPFLLLICNQMLQSVGN